jgi:hypothetical protein
MTHRFVRRAFGLCLALSIGLAAFAQGMYWETVTKGGPLGDEGMKAQMAYMPRMFKVMNPGEDNIMIFRLDKQVMYTLHPAKKTYSQMTFAEMEAAMKKASAKMDGETEDMKKRMASMPEEQRKMMEQMMGDKMGGKASTYEVSLPGDRKTISGYGCGKCVITQDGKDLMTLWVTKEVKGFDAMRRDMEEFSSRMMDMNPMGAKGLADAMKKVDGFPIETETAQGINTLVTKVEKRTTPAAEFEVPAGFTKEKPGIKKGLENE